MRGARVRLASLWVSQTARVLADWCLRMAAVAEAARGGPAQRESAWHLATVIFITPFVLLAPLNGCLSNGLPRRRVLLGSAAWALLAVGAAAALGVPWVVCLGAVALAAAVYSPARYALLPAAAADTHIPLPRVNGWIEMGGAAAIVGGVLLGVELAGPGRPPGLLGVLLGLNALCLVTALPVHFPSDVLRPEPPARAVAGFFRDAGRILRDRESLGSLLGLAAFQAVVTAGSGALLGHALQRGDGLSVLLRALTFTGCGAAAGCALAALQGHPRRNLGFAPLGATGLLASLAWLAGAGVEGGPPALPCFLLGCTGALVNVPLRAAYLAAVPADARGNGMAVMNTLIYVLTSLTALLMLGLTRGGVLGSPDAQLGFLAVLAAAGAAAAWWWLFPQALELVIEWVLWPMYRLRAHGPGRDAMPRRGPLLIVANHASYLDPFWLAKFVPRQLRPMMTSAYYDLPVVRWLMVHVARAIRVQAAGFRREAPELREAADALRAGECVLVFPEAILRRTEERLTRPFGQGVWHILREVPRTPVVACWIEGGWGSFFSYRGGPPAKNKRPDWWRRIDVAFAEPRVLDPAVLADHRTTRAYLRRAVLECRRYLGLPVPEEDGKGTGDTEDTDQAEEHGPEKSSPP